MRVRVEKKIGTAVHCRERKKELFAFYRFNGYSIDLVPGRKISSLPEIWKRSESLNDDCLFDNEGKKDGGKKNFTQ